jgi:NAD(P)H-hydrate epimerase
MENAGRGVAELVMRLNSARQMVTIVCGPGNNGGDGFVIARHLDNMNILASVWCVAPLAPPAKEPDPMWRDVRVSPDSRVNLEILLRSRFSVEFIEDNGLPLPEARREQLSKHLQSREGWIVDAIFGTGLNRAPTSPFRDIIELLNHAGRPILAVDLPSGLDCDSGESLGTTIHASHTGTFVALKKGFLNESAKPFLGEVHVLSIGAPRTLIEEFLR